MRGPWRRKVVGGWKPGRRGGLRNITREAAHARRAWARGREEGPLRGRPRHEEPG
ncbi:hypothetical protein N9L68_08330 [bacterium]|nr:hypothetical protein [bacterium]